MLSIGLFILKLYNYIRDSFVIFDNTWQGLYSNLGNWQPNGGHNPSEDKQF